MVGRSGVIILWGSCGSESLGSKTLGSKTLPRDVELEVRWLLGVRFDACGVDKRGVQKDAWLQNHPARRKTSQRRGKRKRLATRGVALCTSTRSPTAIELRQRTFLFRHALRISMFSVVLFLERDYSKNLVNVNREWKTKMAEFGRRGTPLQVSTSSPTSTGFGQGTLLFGHAIRVSALQASVYLDTGLLTYA